MLASAVGESILIERQVQAGAPITLCLLIFTTTREVASGAALIAQRPPGGRQAIEPLPDRGPRPSVVGSTGSVNLLTTETRQQGHSSVGVLGTFEKVLTAECRAGDDCLQLRLERYSAILSGAYSIRDGMELGVAIPAVHTAAKAAWPMELHDPVRDNGVSDLDYRVIAGVTSSFKKAVAAPPPPPSLSPPSPPPVAPPERCVERFVLQSVHFACDQAWLTLLGQRELNEAAQTLRENPTLLAKIEGHSEAIGTELYRLGLGIRRAEVVKAYLVRQHQLDP